LACTMDVVCDRALQACTFIFMVVLIELAGIWANLWTHTAF